MINRLKEIREKTLKLSLEEFANQVGENTGKHDKWYFQRVQRIEKGATRLNEDMIEDICAAFPQLQPWHFFTDPAKLYPPEHKAIVDAYLTLSPAEQSVVDKIFNQDLGGKHMAQPQSGAQSYSLHEGDNEDSTNIEDRLTPRELEELRKAMREGRL